MDGPSAIQLDPETGFLNDPAAQALCVALENGGHRAYFVGGCVRNAVMGVPISDIDIATDAVPDQVMGLSKGAGFRAVPTGIDHGTITVVVQDQPFEVTTFRRDVETDGRRAVIAFSTDLTEDARRRDFTMNALYADRHGQISDPVCGLQDAYDGRVRFIENAAQRIREDYLRTLRFFRFSAQYAPADAAWDADALSGIADNLEGLESLSAERVGSEMLKLLGAPDPAPALSVMRQTGVLARILPGSDPTFVGPLVHLEQLVKAPIDPIARLVALGGSEVQERLRLSRRNQRHLDSIRALSTMTGSAKVVGHIGGLDAGRGAFLLRSAYGNASVTPAQIDDIATGAGTVFPISASDLPHLSGPALGAELKALKRVWLDSDLSKSKHDLLHP
ncbi:poly(A) polymerase [Tateyamaria omphalii]|uniref:CCA tRNA nucleotidyltransferase n=1 Tax=Tateyamaria omphalii TaxID=299262 RepID=UPI00167BE69C|nr:CCA tRNA nucleotidyltransferase [Tateyamaria omphalii]GGX39989.1 poly(A) polymerase [Tateyamaria omphalii]